MNRPSVGGALWVKSSSYFDPSLALPILYEAARSFRENYFEYCVLTDMRLISNWGTMQVQAAPPCPNPALVLTKTAMEHRKDGSMASTESMSSCVRCTSYEAARSIRENSFEYCVLTDMRLISNWGTMQVQAATPPCPNPALVLTKTAVEHRKDGSMASTESMSSRYASQVAVSNFGSEGDPIYRLVTSITDLFVSQSFEDFHLILLSCRDGNAIRQVLASLVVATSSNNRTSFVVNDDEHMD
ncbi:hypothetical protein NL676_015978 [Syzygium grande]|nr:hypothetical protein NL676_015978 [Syzygium grande]